MSLAHRIRRKVNSFQVIIVSFGLVILLGAFLLSLPVSQAEGLRTPFHEALFTSASAVCVTGLVLHDTMLYWSLFGKVVILLLIQIGGMGVITLSMVAFMASGRKIGLMERSLLQDSISGFQLGGIIRTMRYILMMILVFESLGAVLLMTVFGRDYGLVKGAAFSVFHSVSAFCNAGFDLMGEQGPFSSLTGYRDNPVVVLTIASLIVIGGIGFFTWQDIRAKGLRFRRFRMQTRAILLTSGFLILVPTVLFFFSEYGDLPPGERLLSSLFQAVTPRTAGFNTEDFGAMSGSGQAITIILMLIGGSPGSTAGGFKVTTFFVLCVACKAVFFGHEPRALGRSLDSGVVEQALALVITYIGLFLISGMVISRMDDLPLGDCLFETASAIGTVGLTVGITTKLGFYSRLLVTALMFIGRTGGLTMAWALTGYGNLHKAGGRLPSGKIAIG